MRVLHVLRPDHAAHIGGDLVQLRSYVEALKSLGVDAFAGELGDDIGAPVDIVHFYNLDRTGDLVGGIEAARRRWPQVKVVVSPIFWPAPVGDVVRAYGRHARERAVKYLIKQSVGWRVQRSVLMQADAVCPGTDAEGARQAAWFRLRRDGRWVTVPDGIWLDRWPYRDGPPDRRSTLVACGLDPGLDCLIACAARIESRKNQLALVAAVAQIPGAGLLLVGPVGEPAYGKAVAGLARSVGRVALAGPRTQDELVGLLGGVDVHALPSLQEIPGLSTLEAAAVGCEVVVTPGGSASSYLGSCGHVARSIRPADIAVALSDAIARPTQPALRRQVECYDWLEAGPPLLAAYGRALAPVTRS